MTPTEQDKELRESTRKSIALLVAQRRGEVKWDKQDYIAAGNILFVCTKLITADRKRVALEARIDELSEIPQHPNFLHEYIEHRIAQLEGANHE